MFTIADDHPQLPLSPPTPVELVYEILKYAAEDGEPCPTTSSIAGDIGTYQKAVSALIEELESTGLISVERTDHLRRVTITESGNTTDWTDYGRHTPRTDLALKCPEEWPADYSGQNITRWR